MAKKHKVLAVACILWIVLFAVAILSTVLSINPYTYGSAKDGLISSVVVFSLASVWMYRKYGGASDKEQKRRALERDGGLRKLLVRVFLGIVFLYPFIGYQLDFMYKFYGSFAFAERVEKKLLVTEVRRYERKSRKKYYFESTDRDGRKWFMRKVGYMDRPEEGDVVVIACYEFLGACRVSEIRVIVKEKREV